MNALSHTMTITTRRFLAALLGFAGVVASASGQSYVAFQSEWARVTQNAAFHLGPFQAFLSFDLRRVGYGDNVYFEERPIRDFTATLAPALTFYLPLRRRAIFYVRESPEYTFFLRESRMREFTNGYGAGGKVLLLNRFVLSGDFGRQSRIQAISVELGRPTRETRVAASAGLFYETARRTSIGLTGSIQKFSYADVSSDAGEIPLSSLLDRTERTAGVELYYRVRSEAFWFVRAGATEYRFNQTTVSRDATSVQAVSGLRFPILGRISGTVSFGYKKLDPKAVGRASFSGLVADSLIEARTGRFAVRAGFRRDLGFSYFESAFFYIDNGFSAGGSFYPAGFFRLDYSYTQSRLLYPGVDAADAAAGATVTDPRTDRIWTHSAALVFRVFRTAGLGIQAARDRWTSSVPGWDRDRTYAGVYLTSRF